MAILKGKTELSGIPRGYQKLTITSSAVGFTSAPVDGVFAVLQPVGGAVYWRDDGVDPTTASGMPLNDGDTFIYTGDLTAIKFISAGSVTLHASLYA